MTDEQLPRWTWVGLANWETSVRSALDLFRRTRRATLARLIEAATTVHLALWARMLRLLQPAISRFVQLSELATGWHTRQLELIIASATTRADRAITADFDRARRQMNDACGARWRNLAG